VHYHTAPFSSRLRSISHMRELVGV